MISDALFLISLLDPDYLAFVESLNKAEEPPPSIEAHLEEIEAKKCKHFQNTVLLNLKMFSLGHELNLMHISRSCCLFVICISFGLVISQEVNKLLLSGMLLECRLAE